MFYETVFIKILEAWSTTNLEAGSVKLTNSGTELKTKTGVEMALYTYFTQTLF